MNRVTKLLAALLAIATHTSCLAGLADGMAFFKQGRHPDALRELVPLAEQGVPLAQMLVAIMYSDGRGISKDPAEGLKWYLKAAEQGLALAQISAGDAYFLGMGARRDPAEAMKWYSRAAAQGWTQALFNVGSMYSSGQGVDHDLIAAYKWCLLSAHGTPAGRQRERALVRCDRIKPQLSSSDISQARKLAGEFFPKPENTQDMAGRIYDACMRKEEVAAKSAAAEYPMMHSYSICSEFAESCRYSAGASECDAGRKRYEVEESPSK